LTHYRKYYRKNTKLKGSYFVINNKDKTGEMFVRALSRAGIRFETVTPPQCKVNEKVAMEFILDDTIKSVVKKGCCYNCNGQ